MMGIFPDLSYSQFESRLAAGDLLAIYSDGVTETCSPFDQDFDSDLLAATLSEHREKPAAQIVEIVAQRLRDWTNGAPPLDDITLVIARKV